MECDDRYVFHMQEAPGFTVQTKLYEYTDER